MILRGTLLDNKDLKTLEHPDKHSVHCLVDVPNATKVDLKFYKILQLTINQILL